MPEMVRNQASEFALATTSASLYSSGSSSGSSGFGFGNASGHVGAAARGGSLLDVPFSGSALSTEHSAPQPSFGTAKKFVEKTTDMAKVGKVGPGPGAYDTAAGALSSVGTGLKQVVGMPGYGAAAHSFGGKGNVPRDSNPVLDTKKGLVYSRAAQQPMGEQEARQAALRGLGFVSRAAVGPGPGAYNIDLAGRLDAALALNRQQTQTQLPGNSFAVTGATTTIKSGVEDDDDDDDGGGDEEGAQQLQSSSSQALSPYQQMLLRTAALAAQQHKVSPAFSFASTGREERVKLYPGHETFLTSGVFSPDTPGHFAPSFPAPTFGSEPGLYANGTGAAFSLGGANLDRGPQGGGGSGSGSSVENFPDQRLDVLDSIKGEQPPASPYASVPVFSIGKGTRVAAASSGLRTTAPMMVSASADIVRHGEAVVAAQTAAAAAAAQAAATAPTRRAASGAEKNNTAAAGSRGGAQAGRLDEEAIYQVHRGGVEMAPTTSWAKKQARNTAFLLPPPSSSASPSRANSRPSTPPSKAAANTTTTATADTTSGVKRSGRRRRNSRSLSPISSDDGKGGGDKKAARPPSFTSGAVPHFATTVRSPIVAGSGEVVPVDRLWPRDSPGPIRYESQKSFEALDRGLKPHGPGVKLTLAQRFKADRREDGSMIEHPFDAMETKRRAEKTLDQGKKKGGGGGGGGRGGQKRATKDVKRGGANGTIQKAGARAIGEGATMGARTLKSGDGASAVVG
jgi:hypothetical protein